MRAPRQGKQRILRNALLGVNAHDAQEDLRLPARFG